MFMEELLRFFHVGCRGLLAKLPEGKQILHLGNIDIQVANYFYLAASAPKQKKLSRNKLQEALLDLTRPLAKEIGLDIEDDEASLRAAKQGEGYPRAAWIRFKKEGEPEPVAALPQGAPQAGAVAVPTSISSIQFDELTGLAINAQVSFEKQKDTKVAITLPLAEWCKGGGHHIAQYRSPR